MRVRREPIASAPRARETNATSTPVTRTELTWPGKYDEHGVRAASVIAPVRLRRREVYGASAGAEDAWHNRLYGGDNLAVMHALTEELRGKIDLVYIDPPFGTGTDFTFTAHVGEQGAASRDRSATAYRDTWGRDPGRYLGAMADRLALIRPLLSERGTVFVHCDWHVGHLLRCVLDEVFGRDAFKNEIVWRYRRWPARTKAFQRMHDVLFWYGKDGTDAHTWNTLYEPLAASTQKTWGTKRQVADFSSGRRRPSQTDEETPGAPMSDVWDIGIIAPIARERVGYPTQKPAALLERVIAAASRPGDLVADFFCGSGTTLEVAERLGRRWIGCDLGALAVHTSRKRLLERAVAPGLPGVGPASSPPFAVWEAVPDVASAGRSRARVPAGGPPTAGRDDVGEAALGLPIPARGGTVTASLVAAPDGRTRARLDGFRPDASAVGAPRGADARWSDLIDAWAVDPAHPVDDDDAPLVSRWHAQRLRQRRALPLESATFERPPPGHGVLVQVVDVFGGVSRLHLAPLQES